MRTVDRMFSAASRNYGRGFRDAEIALLAETPQENLTARIENPRRTRKSNLSAQDYATVIEELFT